MVLLDTGTPGNSRETFSEDADDEKILKWELFDYEHKVATNGLLIGSVFSLCATGSNSTY